MALTPSIIIRQCALRIGAYRGQPAAIEASYVLADPATNMVSESFPKSSLYDQILAVEQEIAGAVAMNVDHPWRALSGLADITAPLASGELVPAVGSSNSQIIGVYGEVRDAEAPFHSLTKDLPASEIRAIALSFSEMGAMYKSNYFSYSLDGRRLDHTRTTATVDVCVFDFTSRKTAIDNNANLIFQNAENAYLSGTMSMLKNTDAQLAELAGLYQPRFEAWLTAFQAGKTELS